MMQFEIMSPLIFALTPAVRQLHRAAAFSPNPELTVAVFASD
jgi:hypothetical protein